MLRTLAAVLAGPLLAAVARGQVCVAAPPAAPFALSNYSGTWFEIGKIQTFGGAIFESSCTCTQLIVTPAAAPAAAPGDATVLNSCRSQSPAGDFINATGQLVNMAPPGHWDETFLPPVFKGEAARGLALRVGRAGAGSE
jgi:lipocalin